MFVNNAQCIHAVDLSNINEWFIYLLCHQSARAGLVNWQDISHHPNILQIHRTNDEGNISVFIAIDNRRLRCALLQIKQFLAKWCWTLALLDEKRAEQRIWLWKHLEFIMCKDRVSSNSYETDYMKISIVLFSRHLS